MRIKRRGLCISLACVMFVTVGPVGDYRGKINAEDNISQIVDIVDEKVVPMIALSGADGLVQLTEESVIEGIKLEDNILTLDGYKGGSINIDGNSSKIAELDIVVKGENTIIGNLLSNRTNIRLSGEGILTINELDVDKDDNKEIIIDRNGLSIYDGDFTIDGPRVIINDSKDGVRVISTKVDVNEEEKETESIIETESVTETESSTETESVSESESASEVESETQIEETSEVNTEGMTEGETEEETTEEETEEVSEENTEGEINTEQQSETESETETGDVIDDEIEYSDCKFTMKSGSLVVNMIPTAIEENKGVVKYVYSHGVFAENVFLEGGAIKVEYKDVDNSLSKINNEMSILSETKDGDVEGVIIYSNHDLLQTDTRFIIITPKAYSGNVKLHSEYENVSVNSKKIVYLNSSDIKNLKVKIFEDKYTYDGSAKTPEVTIKGLIKDVDYKVSYSDNVKPGKASVKVDGIDMFTGSVIVNFTIEKKPEVKTVTKTVVKKTTPVKKKVKKTEKVYKVGYKFEDSSFIYEIRKSGTRKKNGEAKIVGLRKKKVSKVAIKGVVKYKKVRYKVTEIQKNAFSKLKKLEKITIGKNVKFIGEGVLANCKNLKKVTFRTVIIKKIGMGAFAETPEEFIIKVPKAKFKKYRKLLKKAGYEGIIK